MELIERREMSLEKLIIELENNSTTALVKAISSVNDSSVTNIFKASAEALSNMFSKSYQTGFLPVSEDGVIFIEEREGRKLVILQRAARSNQTMFWLEYNEENDAYEEEEYEFATPYTFGFWLLEAYGSSYRIIKERLYCSSGGSLGAATPIYDTYWMGNIYGNVSSNHSNICWGSSRVVVNGEVTIASLMNLLNDYFNQTFNYDLGGGESTWSEYTQYKNVSTFANSLGTMNDIIERMWG